MCLSEDGNANTKGQQYFLTFPGLGAISTVLCRAVSVEDLCSCLDGLVSWACWDTHQTGLDARSGKRASAMHLTNACGILRAPDGVAVTYVPYEDMVLFGWNLECGLQP